MCQYQMCGYTALLIMLSCHTYSDIDNNSGRNKMYLLRYSLALISLTIVKCHQIDIACPNTP